MLNRRPSEVTIRRASGINVLAGFWLLLSPAALTYIITNSAVAINDMIVGALMIVVGLIRVSTPHRAPALSGINVALGLWTMISPWIYGLTLEGTRVGPAVFTGIVVMLCAVWSATLTLQLQRGLEMNRE